MCMCNAISVDRRQWTSMNFKQIFGMARDDANNRWSLSSFDGGGGRNADTHFAVARCHCYVYGMLNCCVYQVNKLASVSFSCYSVVLLIFLLLLI